MSNIHGPNIVTDGIIHVWDAANRKSYTGAGTTLSDLAFATCSICESGGLDGTTGLRDLRADATLTNGASFSTDNLGVIEFDGTNDFLALDKSFIQMGIATSGVPYGSTEADLSWMAWIKPSVIDGTIVGDTDGGYSSTINFRIDSADNKLKNSVTVTSAYVWGYQTISVASTTTLSADTWYHVAVTYGIGTGIGEQCLYISGELEDTEEFGGYGGGGCPGAGCRVMYYNRCGEYAMQGASFTSGVPCKPFQIGCNNTEDFFEGQMANMSMYNKAITAGEVKQNFNALKGRFGL